MATLEITNKTLKLVGTPVQDDDEWWLRLLKSLFNPKDDPRKRHEVTYPLSGVRTAGLAPGKTPQSFEWLIRNGMKPRDFWTLFLVLQNDRTKVISSRDYGVMKLAFDKVHEAMNAPDGFIANVNIENSTIVIDSDIGGDVKTDVSSDKPERAA